MRFLKKMILMIVCFYYCVLTPGSVSQHQSIDQYLWGAVSLGVFQGLVGLGLGWFFGWSLEGTLVFSVFVGVWTMIGVMVYPSLGRMLEEDEIRSAHVRARWADEEEEKKRAHSWSEVDKTIYKRLKRTDRDAALQYVLEAEKFLKKKKLSKIEFAYLRSDFIVKQELESFGIHRR